MTNYAAIAQHNWKTLAPSTYQQMTQEMDIEAHFKTMGHRAEQIAGELAYQYQGQDSLEETYMQKVGRINAAMVRAREQVIAEELTPPRYLWEEQQSLEDIEKQKQHEQDYLEMRKIDFRVTEEQLAQMTQQEQDDALYSWKMFLQELESHDEEERLMYGE